MKYTFLSYCMNIRKFSYPREKKENTLKCAINKNGPHMTVSLLLSSNTSESAIVKIVQPRKVRSGLIDLTFYISHNWRTNKGSQVGNGVPRLMSLTDISWQYGNQENIGSGVREVGYEVYAVMQVSDNKGLDLESGKEKEAFQGKKS